MTKTSVMSPTLTRSPRGNVHSFILGHKIPGMNEITQKFTQDNNENGTEELGGQWLQTSLSWEVSFFLFFL
jgi:hypothetical protein